MSYQNCLKPLWETSAPPVGTRIQHGIPWKTGSLGDHCVNSLLAKRKGTRSLSLFLPVQTQPPPHTHTQIIIIKRKFKEVCEEVPGSR